MPTCNLLSPLSNRRNSTFRHAGPRSCDVALAKLSSMAEMIKLSASLNASKEISLSGAVCDDVFKSKGATHMEGSGGCWYGVRIRSVRLASPGRLSVSLLFIGVRSVSTRSGGDVFSARPLRFWKGDDSRAQGRWADERGLMRVWK
jgi:hypothetical protein